MVEAELFVSNQSDISQRWAIVEETGEATYLYLTEPGSMKPTSDAFLFSKVILESGAEVQSIAESGMPPPILRKYATSQAQRKSTNEAQISFKWSASGEAVAVLLEDEPFAAIAGGVSYSKAVAAEGPWGVPWSESALNEF
ncbi:hypothetical protein [Pontibacterium sp.]|uniref:hypothetical protein n=1 Tax=Pontibacterium sp. TaxID=2036026 RepID=UPI003566F128